MSAVWVAPTARAISWWPLAGVGALLAAAAVLAEYADFHPADILGLAAASLAASVAAGLRDPAAALLSAMPTSAAVRRARRLALLLGAELTLWAALDRADLSVPLGGLVAMTAVGVAVAAWAGPAAGVAVPLAWVLIARAGGLGWDQHHAIVTVVALAALWAGRNR